MYNCSICNNEQWIIYTDKDGYECVKPCQCQKIRKSLKLAEESGLGNLLSIYTFDNYKTDLEWQKDLKNNALQYVKEPTNKWFIAFGTSGSGKSHLCTAICKELLNQGKEVVFMSWLEESGKLKRHITDNDYDTLIDRYKNAEVLYIDDFWKNENSTEPTSADIKLANEILNYRYNKARATNSLCKTIISSERLMAQLIDYDSAIAGRLVEMSKGYLNEIKGAEKNYRLKGFV